MFNIRISGNVRNISIGIIIAVLTTITVFLFLLFPYQVQGDSMSPTFNTGDRILAFRTYIKSNLKRFDIIVSRNPLDFRKKIIKRIIALPGEKFKIKKGMVFINGKKINQPFLKKSGDVIFSSVNLDKFTIPEESFFIMGDNRNISRDSREFGPVNIKLFIGKVFLKYWPLTSSGKKS